ncbi:DMT family transporter [Pseudomonas sp. dw_358]|uniref:DMT family transporter n=1 Tax=Pseudomonas sp. dw_358 TaxID=2720083 RepID=UPI001BD2A4FB|nr:DMT family transporter [Pseudomonas sp. dw_358]
MNRSTSSWVSLGVMPVFVLLWGSAAIFTRWGLNHGSPFTLLILRFSLALAVMLLVGCKRRRWLPAAGTRLRVAATGFMLIGGYSICYFQAMNHGITPGVIATLLGVQPILTLLLLERRISALRIIGLGTALSGLVLVVYQSLLAAQFSLTGSLFALAALGFMTLGAILQKQVQQHPADVMPLQYGVSLLLCVAFAPFEPLDFSFDTGLVVPVIWLGLVISVGAQLMLYRMIQSGNLVNVTSLFYLVPVVTVVLDYLLLGNTLSPLSLAGMALIMLGLAAVFKAPRRGLCINN